MAQSRPEQTIREKKRSKKEKKKEKGKKEKRKKKKREKKKEKIMQSRAQLPKLVTSTDRLFFYFSLSLFFFSFPPHCRSWR